MAKQIDPTRNFVIPESAVEKVDFAGSEIIFTLNRYAYKADAAITVQKGETVILATVGTGKLDIESNFLPLSVEYIEKMYAGGIISSSRFLKREARPSGDAVLKARQVDHAIRSLFPKSWRKPVSVVITVLAYDGENDPEQLAVIGASTALMLSSVPFFGPSTSIKAGLTKSGETVWGPKASQEEELTMDLVFSVVDDRILNIEGWADQTPEETAIEIMREAVEKCQPMLTFQKTLAEKYGREKSVHAESAAPVELIQEVEETFGDRIKSALLIREIREDEFNDIKKTIALNKKAEEDKADDQTAVNTNDIETAVEYVARKILRKMALENEERTSGRSLDEIRQLEIEVGVLPRVHGSAVFTRGLTQCLSVLTLGSSRDAQTLESFEGEEQKRFMHHYASPNFSYGDAGRYSYYPGRREIGHGNIGENALRRMIPTESDFPYTIRLSSEIMSSNGFTSMAATCASTLALLDGGVKLKALIGGVALGLITEDDDTSKYKILVDMEDVEDFYGDMDFKVAGSKNGITAIQMDNKLKGVPVEILEAAFMKSKSARTEILEAMEKVIGSARENISKHAPQIEILQINPEKIGELIGPGGKTIKSIIEECENEVEIDIKDSGEVFIFSKNPEMQSRALQMIGEMMEEAEIGKTYKGVVDKITDYGMFVDVSKNISGLVHVSEVKDGFVKDANEVFKVGDEVRVKVIGKDNMGRIKLSAKQADQ